MKVANNSEEFLTNFKAQTNEMAENVNKQLEVMENEYFEALSEFQEMKNDEDFISRWDYYPLIRKISQLGLAVEKMGKAYSAINSARCI